MHDRLTTSNPAPHPGQGHAWRRCFVSTCRRFLPVSKKPLRHSASLQHLRTPSALEPMLAWLDGAAGVMQMKVMPTDDPLFGKGSIRIGAVGLRPVHQDGGFWPPGRPPSLKAEPYSIARSDGRRVMSCPQRRPRPPSRRPWRADFWLPVPAPSPCSKAQFLGGQTRLDYSAAV